MKDLSEREAGVDKTQRMLYKHELSIRTHPFRQKWIKHGPYLEYTHSMKACHNKQLMSNYTSAMGDSKIGDGPLCAIFSFTQMYQTLGSVPIPASMKSTTSRPESQLI